MRLFLLMIVPLIILYSAEIEANNSEAQNIIESSGYGKSSVSESKLSPLPEEKKVDYTREILHNFYMNAQTIDIRAESIAKKAEMVKVLAVSEVKSSEANPSKEETTTIKGYCLIKNDVHIGKQPSSLGVDCETNIGFISLFANLKAENKISTLFVDPVYIEFKNYRYQVKSSYVTNEAKTSYNIATYVNERKLTEVGLDVVGAAADEVKTASNQYLMAYEQSRLRQDTQVYQNGLTAYPIQNIQYETPDPLLYVAKAGINLVASSTKAIADAFKKDLPYLYMIAAGTRIYVDMQVISKGEKVGN
ncbi:hypothetical protein [Helicobacter sp. MIT 14-3879]|uniref:hypothetical protein n=1 Tax=Helicobacter sp. MIT 14-3879 TaxID=2040649 RepID=UPI000E1F5365|nr:hypothetical protein [Helicobacter sp. MIT 14-3879]RDU61859.1 hypothetical protein CQA44_07990 [Helicobacter sp. MIT 14-3879]